jgi:ectoine hydroxylase
MHLTDAQLAEYDSNGFLILPDAFTAAELALLRTELRRVSASDAPGLHREDNGDVRTIYRLHHPASPTHSRYFEKFVTMPRIAQAAKTLLGDEIYVFQTKCNFKPPIRGGIYAWHQDFGHWQHDGIPGPEMVTSLLMLDDATEVRGCLYFIPGSHKHGILQPRLMNLTSTMQIWSIPDDVLITAMQEMRDPVPIEGRPGTLVLFHPNLLHASGHNLSRHSRWHVYAVFNRISNKHRNVEKPRPEWAVDREFRRVELTDDNLLELDRLETVER